jgi:hypothetical protein
MSEATKDRRCAPRTSMRLPLVVRLLNGSNPLEEHTFTRDVSFSGCYFYLAGETGGRRDVEITMTLPPEGDSPTGIQVRYTGKVARLEPSEEGRLGVAATFANCEYVARA